MPGCDGRHKLYNLDWFEINIFFESKRTIALF